MGRILLTVLILTFVLFGGLVSICNATYQRPWENRNWVLSNPSIYTYGFEYWWNLPELHKTIASLDIESATSVMRESTILGKAGQPQYASTTSKYLSIARSSALNAENNLNSCMFDIITAIGLLPSFPTSSFLHVFSNHSNCVQYKQSWVNSIDYSLIALESSSAASEETITNARSSYEEIKFAGICSPDYTGPGSENCAELASAFYAVDNNIVEGKYGKYNLYKTYSDQVSINLLSSTPDLSLFVPMLGLVWGENGVIETFGSIQNMSRASRADAERAYQEKLRSATTRKEVVETSMRSLGSEKLYLIVKAPASYSMHTTGSISARFESIQNETNKLGISFSEAKLCHGMTTTSNFLSDSINSIDHIDGRYLELESKLSSLEDDARSIVVQMKNEAETEISTTRDYLVSSSSSLSSPGSKAFELMKQAEMNYRSGESATALGESFVYYSDAASVARAARNSGTYSQELADRTSLALLKSLIGRAEKDGINVAEEKESLELMAALPADVVGSQAQKSIELIISKARTKYEEQVLATRQRLYDKLSLAGPDAADLYTDLANYEDGLIEDNAILFPDAIGSLKRLESDYAEFEDTMDAYMQNIVGNAMSTSAKPLISDVKLDVPATITLDASFTNPRPYNATHVSTSVRTDSPFQFFYSDIISGKEDVESVRSAEDGRTTILTFYKIKSYETKYIVFEKKSVIAHTEKTEFTAEGIGDGAAYVTEQIRFTLDAAVPIGCLASDIANVPDMADLSDATYTPDITIDGIPIPIQHQLSQTPQTTQTSKASGGSQAILSEGPHVLVSKGIVDNTYEESIENIKTYKIGVNSRVEFNIKITPKINLDSVSVFINSRNDSSISAMVVSATTGEIISSKERLSETQYSVKVLNMKKGRPAVLTVSYNVQDTEAYVAGELARLEGVNMSTAATELLHEARVQADLGNNTGALELIERSLAAEKSNQLETKKLQSRYTDLTNRLVDELSDINSALNLTAVPSSPSLYPVSSSSQLIQKLSARKTEIERILADTDGASGAIDATSGASASNASDTSGTNVNLTSALNMLEKVDYGWLEKTLTAFKKESYSRYNSLKARFYNSGNTTTPPEFLAFEAAFNKLETGNRVEYAVETVNALQAIESLIISQEGIANTTRSQLASTLQSLESETLEVLGTYSRQATAAKNTEYASLFTETQSKISKLVKDAEDALNQNLDLRIVAARLDALNKTKTRIENTLEILKNESQAKLLLLEGIFREKKFDDTKQNTIRQKLDNMGRLISTGDYINALRAGTAITTDLEQTQEPASSNNLLLFGITVTAILTGAGFYLARQPRQKKELKKLASMKDQP